jgi:hypothetical protein
MFESLYFLEYFLELETYFTFCFKVTKLRDSKFKSLVQCHLRAVRAKMKSQAHTLYNGVYIAIVHFFQTSPTVPMALPILQS